MIAKGNAIKMALLSGVFSAGFMFAVSDVMAQGGSASGSVFAPDPSVFEQLTDLQRQISILEREVVLEDLKLRRRELDLQMEELERRSLDRELERERVQRVEQEENERERLERERQEAIRRAEEDLRISALRAEREALLRSLEIATEQEEAAAEAARQEAEASDEEAENTEDDIVVVPSSQVRRRVNSASPQPNNLIVAPGAPTAPAPATTSSDLEIGAFDADLAALTDMLGVQPPIQPEPEVAPEDVEVSPPPEPDPIPPVVRRVRGAAGNISATLVLLGGGQVEVVEGDKIPGGWSIVSITPSQVEARHEDGEEAVRLAFGTRVVEPMQSPAPMVASIMPEPVEAPQQAGLSGGFGAIGTSGSFPIPGGFSGF